LSHVQRFSRFCSHQPVKLRIAGELIGERYKGAAQLQKPMTDIHVGDIGELRVGDFQEFGELHAVSGRLIEHDQEFGVCQHGARRVGLEHIVHVLRDAGTEGTVFAHALPEREQEIGAVFVLEQKINLVDHNEGAFALCAVLGDAVEDAIKHNQHPDRLELLAQIKDVIADEAVVHVHIRLLGERGQAAVCEQFDGKGQLRRLRLRLPQQLFPEVFERRRFDSVFALLVVPVDIGCAAVDERLLLWADTISADGLIAEREYKLGLKDERIFSSAVFSVQYR